MCMLKDVNEVTAAHTNPSNLVKKMCRVEWLGQTIASTLWMMSVFAYGIEVLGDWLQILAASAWLIANIAALSKTDSTAAKS